MARALSVLSIFVVLVVTLEAASLTNLYGTNAGAGFNDLNSSSTTQALTAIRLHYGWVVDGIQGQYMYNGRGSPQWMPLHGTNTQYTEIHVAYPHERFVRVTGKYGPYSNEQQQGITVTELSFATYNNITGKTITYGPYGGHEAANQTTFQTADGAEIISMYGFTSDYMRGIGFTLAAAKSFFEFAV